VSLVGQSEIATIVDCRDEGNAFTILANNVSLSRFRIQHANGGIEIESNNNVIANNLIVDCYGACAIRMWDSTANLIRDNNLIDNNVGIGVFSSSEGNIVESNRIDKNSVGVFLSDADHNVIQSNTITLARKFGIHLQGSSSNVISGNIMIDNNVSLCSRDNLDNIIYHNNFINNTIPALSLYGSIDTWDNNYPSGGNYWSDYSGTDFHSGPYQNETSSDGIGDIPYVIDGNNQDNYPLMKPGPYYRLTVTSSPITGIQFTINGVSQATLYTEWLFEHFYTLTMSETYGEYVWSHWLEDGDTNRTKTIVLTSDADWTGVFRFPSDVNGDGKVRIDDVLIVAEAFGTDPDHPRWNPLADLNGDNLVRIDDVLAVALNFGFG